MREFDFKSLPRVPSPFGGYAVNIPENRRAEYEEWLEHREAEAVLKANFELVPVLDFNGRFVWAIKEL
jgi:hypothetical protein